MIASALAALQVAWRLLSSGFAQSLPTPLLRRCSGEWVFLDSCPRGQSSLGEGGGPGFANRDAEVQLVCHVDVERPMRVHM
jgi:hypothetical protein